MKWIDINEQLPIDTSEHFGTTYIVTVICNTWKTPKTMIMEWEEAIIRNKKVQRWKWNEKIKDKAWIVTHWMELPEPAMSKDESR